eukprot:CAMPEP_0194771598 /NCGR_PEP_ID=MMETSP0323_2-20130528/49637_1 /TAXON_ID=2866 ORGANISM="Crypthecodinium cohnii, Strain Seligo" /NCGR_SAMPLE_ID=MMETSP0323_2 /ASSEMBLY_ACC=CAM_ASM_000346 /LENGTH=61 /DNA_ID=CAMNT_0039705767 /DNA_START=8 /DNA_END=190 /DNA_ORIENTATION=-
MSAWLRYRALHLGNRESLMPGPCSTLSFEEVANKNQEQAAQHINPPTIMVTILSIPPASMP